MIVQLSRAAWSHYIPMHMGGGEEDLGPWTIIARKDRNTLIEKSVTLIEQLLFRSCFSNIVKVSKMVSKM